MTKNKYREWIKKLKKYWEMRSEAYRQFYKEEAKIEELMKKEIGEDLTFRYGNGYCQGIVHKDWDRHNPEREDHFPLIDSHDLEFGTDHGARNLKNGE